MITRMNRKGYEPVTIKIYIRDKGIVLEEPSLIAFDKNTGKVLGVGEETNNIVDKDNQEILIVCPLRWGVIADYTATVKMFKAMIQKAVGHKLQYRRKPNIVVCIPKDTTEVERRAFEEAFYQIRAKKLFLSEVSFVESISGLSDVAHIIIGITPLEVS